MKTNYLQRSSRAYHRHHKRRMAFFVVSIFLGGVIFFSVFGNSLSSALSPLWHSNMLARSGLLNLIGSLRTKDALVSENNALKERLANDEELIVSLRSIASSRDELLASFGRVTEPAVPASVLVHPPETPYDVLLVDVGENQKVATGDLVSMTDEVLIGTVTDVFSKTSRVKLYSTAGTRTDAVLERGGVSVTLVGRGGGNFEFTVPRDTNVEPGDRILSTQLNASLLGVVGSIEVTPTDSFKTVIVRSPANPSDIRYVIIKK